MGDTDKHVIVYTISLLLLLLLLLPREDDAAVIVILCDFTAVTR